MIIEEDQVDTLVENIRVDLVKELRVRIVTLVNTLFKSLKWLRLKFHKEQAM